MLKFTHVARLDEIQDLEQRGEPSRGWESDMPSQPNQKQLSDIEELILDPPSRAKQPTRRKPIWLLVALALSLSVAVALIPSATRSFIYPSTEKGECLAFDPRTCVSLSTTHITETFSVRLPDNAEVVESGSRGNLLQQTQHAIVAVEADQIPFMLQAYEPHDSGTLPQVFLDLGLESVEQELIQQDGNSTAFVGTNAQGETLVCLLWTLD